MKDSLIKTGKVGSLDLKWVVGRKLSQPSGDVMEMKWVEGHQKNFTKMACAERAYTGCRNPTATPRQRQALALMMSRQ